MAPGPARPPARRRRGGGERPAPRRQPGHVDAPARILLPLASKPTSRNAKTRALGWFDPKIHSSHPRLLGAGGGACPAPTLRSRGPGRAELRPFGCLPPAPPAARGAGCPGRGERGRIRPCPLLQAPLQGCQAQSATPNPSQEGAGCGAGGTPHPGLHRGSGDLGARLGARWGFQDGADAPPSPPSLAVERRRRDKINNWIVQLSKIIPDCSMENTKSGQVGDPRHLPRGLGVREGLAGVPLPSPVPSPPVPSPEQGRDPLQSLRLHPGAAAEQPPPLRGAAGPRPAPDGQRGLAAAGEGAGVPPRVQGGGSVLALTPCPLAPAPGGGSEEQEPDPAGAAPPARRGDRHQERQPLTGTPRGRGLAGGQGSPPSRT